VLGYVKMSIHDILELDASMLSDPKIYIDAAYGVHQNGRSHSGCVITLGEHGGTVDARSSK
jgi:hypothetical protein